MGCLGVFVDHCFFVLHFIDHPTGHRVIGSPSICFEAIVCELINFEAKSNLFVGAPTRAPTIRKPTQTSPCPILFAFCSEAFPSSFADLILAHEIDPPTKHGRRGIRSGATSLEGEGVKIGAESRGIELWEAPGREGFPACRMQGPEGARLKQGLCS